MHFCVACTVGVVSFLPFFSSLRCPGLSVCIPPSWISCLVCMQESIRFDQQIPERPNAARRRGRSSMRRRSSKCRQRSRSVSPEPNTSGGATLAGPPEANPLDESLQSATAHPRVESSVRDSLLRLGLRLLELSSFQRSACNVDTKNQLGTPPLLFLSFPSSFPFFSLFFSFLFPLLFLSFPSHLVFQRHGHGHKVNPEINVAARDRQRVRERQRDRDMKRHRHEETERQRDKEIKR